MAAVQQALTALRQELDDAKAQIAARTWAPGSWRPAGERLLITPWLLPKTIIHILSTFISVQLAAAPAPALYPLAAVHLLGARSIIK